MLLVERETPVVYQQSNCKRGFLTSTEQCLATRSDLTCDSEFKDNIFLIFFVPKNPQYFVWLKAFVTQEACGTEMLPVDLRG